MTKKLFFIYLFIHNLFISTSIVNAASWQAKDVINRLNVNSELPALTGSIVGENIDSSSGELSFFTTDADIPGNFPIPVKVSRSLQRVAKYQRINSLFGSAWSLEIPRVTDTILLGSYWSDYRCSQGGEPIPGVKDYENHWNGMKFYSGNGGSEVMLQSAELTTGVRFATKSNWVFKCTSSIDNGSGEGFIGLSPTGVKYTFAHLQLEAAPPYHNGQKIQQRKVGILYVTRADDLYGNWVKYNWSGDQLNSISSSDGRLIEFSYTNNKISSITAHNKTWVYEYGGEALHKVYLPDNTYWEYGLSYTGLKSAGEKVLSSPSMPYQLCSAVNPNPTVYQVYAIHPNGARVDFELKEIKGWFEDVPYGEVWPEGGNSWNQYLYDQCFFSFAVQSKKVSGPGIPDLVWTYGYDLGSGSWLHENKELGDKIVTVTNPDGSSVVSYIDRHFDWRSGQVNKVEIKSGVQTIQAIEYEKSKGAEVGSILLSTNTAPMTHRIQTTGKITFQDGDEFRENMSAFDTFGRPTQILESNSLSSATKKTNFTYQDYLSDWVLGLPKKTTINDIETSRLDFCTSNTSTCRKYLPYRGYKNGVKVVDWTYHTDGNYKTLTDANNNTYTFSNYKRGIPRTVYAPGITNAMTAVVNDNGSIDSVTDFSGNTHEYDYDSLGRLIRTTFPLENGSSYWQDSTINYEQVDFDDLAIAGAGLESGQWKQVITHGSYRKIQYFDALMRKVLTKEEDLADPDSIRFQRNRFDANNRITFASRPSSDAGETKGTQTDYDAVGRPVKNILIADTNIEQYFYYLNGNRKQVVNGRNYTTTYTYQAFGSPTQNAVIKIEEPEGVSTTINRDVFGKINWVKQAGGSVSSTRNYYYDSRQQLCRTYHPETGYTAQYIDNAGLKKWELVGTGTNYCNQSAAPSGATQFFYNARNAIDLIDYPSGTTDFDFDYDNNNNMTMAKRGSIRWDYTYNSLNGLSTEKLSLDNRTFNIAYAYDGRGQISSLTYPSGRRVDFIPDAFGRPTQANNYATNAHYHASGLLIGFTYGNGQQYSLTPNARMLPERITTGNHVDMQYDYDNNANISSFTDYKVSGQNRTMSYDGLDRLKTANGPWGSGQFNYDALGNISYKQLGGNTYSYSYNQTNNKLTGISGSKAYSFEYDALGNVKNNGHHTFNFDKASLMLNVNNANVATYNYDAHKRRVYTIEAGKKTYHIYSKAGQLLHKLDASNNKPSDYIYLGGKTIAKVDGAPGTQGLAPPAYLTVPETDSDGSYSVNWSSVSGATSYTLQEKKDSGNWTTVYSGGALSKFLSGRSSGTYQYRVRSCSGSICSYYRESNLVEVSSPVPTVPSTPTGLSAPSADNDGIYNVTWNSVSNANTYEIQKKINSGSWNTVQNNSQTIYNANTPFDATYAYRVRACNSYGCSSYSASVQTVVITEPGGGGGFQL